MTRHVTRELSFAKIGSKAAARARPVLQVADNLDASNKGEAPGQAGKV
jgi:hypothetical protein